MSRDRRTIRAHPRRTADAYPVKAARYTTILCALFAALVGVSSVFGGPMVSVSGTWNLTLDASMLNPPNKAGANFSSTYSSLLWGTGTPIVVHTWVGGPWTVRVSRTLGSWPATVALIARISSPTSNPPITINNDPVTVTDLSKVFYQSSVADVTIYYELRNVSLENLTATTYSTVVTFTVTSP
jgi:hypothetical protein